MENSTPFEIMSAPFEVYVANVGSDFPAVDEVPDTNDWALVGTSGNKNINEDGVKLALQQTLAYFKGLGNMGDSKAFRVSEGAEISFKLADVSAEQFAQVMEFQTVDTDAAGVGTPGTKSVGLSRGRTVTRKALMLRGPSPYMTDGVLQFQIPVAIQAAPAQEIEGKKDTPVMLALLYKALEDPNAANDHELFGKFVAQTADAT